MSDDNKNQLYAVEMPPMIQLQNEIVDLENEFYAKLQNLENKWHLDVMSIEYNGDDVALRCEVRNSKIH
jgi:predicted metalloenzyme YecM